MNELAPHHLPSFITGPSDTDVLFVLVVVIVIVAVLLVGTSYLWLHSLPERLAHGAQKTQFQMVAVLALIALFTHNNIFWIAALLLAIVKIPDFISPVKSIAESLGTLAAQGNPRPAAPAPAHGNAAPDAAMPDADGHEKDQTDA